MCLTSKAIHLILLWSFLIYYVGYSLSLISGARFVSSILKANSNVSSQVISIGYNASYALFYLFYPLGGLIGDIGWGRYKIIKRSLMFLTITSTMLFVSGCLEFVEAVHPSIFIHNEVIITMACLVLIGIFGLVGFFANIIPFAMDQLRDSPAQESRVFIYWYIWTVFTSSFVSVFIFSFVDGFYGFGLPERLIGITCLIALSIVVVVTLVVSLILTGQRPVYFNVEPCNVNPYKLVYRVTQFALQHKIPIHRSAFTYCEDEPPSRLDLGKVKYGGPFTTEEVEDVKVYYEILKVLVSLGPFMYIIGDISFASFSCHISENSGGKYAFHMLSNLLIATTIPLYLYFCQHRLFHHFPEIRLLQKVEIGLIIAMIKFVFMLAVDIAAHVRDEELNCMFRPGNQVPQVFSPLQVSFILVAQQILSALSQAILYTSFFEFICAQSPHSMRGMLIGLAYALLGFFQLLGVILMIPFQYWNQHSGLSCGFVYYSMCIIISLVTFILYVWVAKRYKYRERDEPSRVRQFAEEYYSNTQQERHYDYSTSLELSHLHAES